MCPACRSARAAACRSPTRSRRTASTKSRSGSRAIWTGTSGGCGTPRPHELILLIDREPVATFTIQKPAGDDTTLDKDLKMRVTVRAGPHEIGVTFVKDGSSLLETARQPLQSRFNERRHPRTGPPSTRFR